MDYRQLGQTDLKVSELCLGTMTFGWSADKDASFAIMDAAYEAGINFFDTADVYTKWIEGNPGGVAEQWIGDWLADRGHSDMLMATKVRGRMWDGPDGEGLSRTHMMRAVEESLQRLQIEQIDLYQSHHPDESTPQEETLRAYDDLIQQGKVRYIGCSNHDAGLMTEALETSAQNGLPRYESLQPNYSLVHRDEFERELMALCEREGIGVIPYSPLGRGFLTGKYREGIPKGSRGDRAQDRIRSYVEDDRYTKLLDEMEVIGQRHGKSIAQVALAWQLSQPVISSPIIGASTVEQVEESLGAAGFRLDEDAMQSLNALSS